jgi:hypothetical protein
MHCAPLDSTIEGSAKTATTAHYLTANSLLVAFMNASRNRPEQASGSRV